MDSLLDEDAVALWQDALDLLTEEKQPESFIAMLRACNPTKVEQIEDKGITLYAETSMRLAYNRILKNLSVIERCLSAAAFEDVLLNLTLTKSSLPTSTTSTMTLQEFRAWKQRTNSKLPSDSTSLQDFEVQEQSLEEIKQQTIKRRKNNPLYEETTFNSTLTFDRFVVGDENELAYQQALSVANNAKAKANPLFIYGNSGLGKTHLLRAVQNYINEEDIERLCVYKDADAFVDDYVNAVRKNASGNAATELSNNYQNIDVLIIDDVQKLAGKAGTINFFFNIFNSLIDRGKQIILAADRTPAQLGMGSDGFDDRITSRMSGGTVIGIESPSYEMKINLIHVFCERAFHEKDESLSVDILPEELRRYMADKAGQSIRTLEGFCNRCVTGQLKAKESGKNIKPEEIDKIANTLWRKVSKTVNIEKVQEVVENFYGINHRDLVGNKRNKEIAEPRHVAIYLSHDLCQYTLVNIGKHFGGRKHATILHSIEVIEERTKEDKSFYDQITQIKKTILEQS